MDVINPKTNWVGWMIPIYTNVSGLCMLWKGDKKYGMNFVAMGW